MSIWAAAAVYWLVERLRPTQREGEAPGEPSPKRFASWGLVLGFFALSAVEPILNDLRGNALLKQTDTRIEFMRWLRTQERSKAFVAVDQFSIPLVYRDVADFWTAPFDPRIVYIDSLSSDELDRMDALSEPVNWIAVSDFVTLPGYLEDSYEERRAALQDFAGSAEPARVFQPFEAGWTPKPADSEDAYSPFRNLWNRRSPGPVIELYAIEAGE